MFTPAGNALTCKMNVALWVVAITGLNLVCPKCFALEACFISYWKKRGRKKGGKGSSMENKFLRAFHCVFSSSFQLETKQSKECKPKNSSCFLLPSFCFRSGSPNHILNLGFISKSWSI